MKSHLKIWHHISPVVTLFKIVSWKTFDVCRCYALYWLTCIFFLSLEHDKCMKKYWPTVTAFKWYVKHFQRKTFFFRRKTKILLGIFCTNSAVDYLHLWRVCLSINWHSAFESENWWWQNFGKTFAYETFVHDSFMDKSHVCVATNYQKKKYFNLFSTSTKYFTDNIDEKSERKPNGMRLCQVKYIFNYLKLSIRHFFLTSLETSANYWLFYRNVRFYLEHRWFN